MDCPWGAYEPGTIAFCEERLCAWVVEPSNAWSNVGYLVAGSVTLALARGRAPMILIGLAGILIGLGSFAFHGTGTRIGELLDVTAMYLLGALAVVFGLRRIRPLSTRQLVLAYAGLVAVAVGLLIGLHDNGIVVFAVQLVVAIGAEVYLYATGRRAPTYRWQKWMLASFTVAFVVWLADETRVVCNPHNHVVTGHAVWHVLTALALYSFARHQDALV